ncbi:hypothetical protein CC1G_04103 [Coprinopsis cinerea okayama7|uniref:F-box domain-containing protein n=1 Tax=Coprinopsis cinerea (strain Okayama-7 / 130 / ATCC MYA-4618 / FGSC 9003) TaxID=240176 RepID=A8NVZ9_COPC7|nr:hypothetical protein CC1G_04103 [Coprinopsis cinerea okayama7\|eukprot:XP_001836790.2 hypothetical protein CC1G_04103 [Coprinopsis cinerea okayama7\
MNTVATPPSRLPESIPLNGLERFFKQRDRQPLVQASLGKAHQPVTIDDLPNEILFLIFLEAVDYDNRFDRDSVREADIMTVANISQVCARWRAVVLQHGALWSMVLVVEGNDNGWFKEVFGRIGTSAISIFSRRYRPPTDAMREITKENISRCEHLHLPVRWPADDHTEWSQYLLSQPAPLLKKCVIVNDFDAELPYKFETRFPNTLFHGHAPQLRSLTLINCSLPVPNQPDVFPRLDTLVVQYGPVADLSVLLDRKGIRHTISLLRSFPKLRSVTLDDALVDSIPLHQHPALWRIKPVEMKFLQSLSYTGDATVALALCNRILLPATTTVRLGLRFTDARMVKKDDFVNTMEGIIDLMMKHSRREQHLSITYTHRHWTVGLGGAESRIRFEVDLCTSGLWFMERPFARDADVGDTPMGWDDPFCWLIDYLSQAHELVIRGITSLSLTFQEVGYSFFHCRKLLRLMKDLDTLCVGGLSLGKLEQAAEVWQEDSTLFPLLRKLELRIRSLRRPTTLATIPAFVSRWEEVKQRFKSFTLVLPSIDKNLLVTRGGETFGWILY